MELLKIESITKKFLKKNQKEITVLSDISLSVEKGTCVAIIGPNGSGKTTLLRVLGLLEPPTSGRLFYKSKEITNLSKKETIEHRRKLAFVRQKPVVLRASVFDNIAYGLRVRMYREEGILRRVTQMIDQVGLKGFEKKNARSLSGGEMQRVAIAMNFVLDPEIYLLDELSANLDSSNIKLVETLITNLKKNPEKTIILSTHDPIEAIRFADRVVVLNKGKIAQIGPPSEIFRNPKDEYTAQFLGFENIFTGTAKYDQKSGLNKIKINDLTIISSYQKEGVIKLCIHPESIIISKETPMKTTVRNIFKGSIKEIRDLGNTCHIVVTCNFEQFLAKITQSARDDLDLKPNSEIFIQFKATDVKIL